MAKEKLEKTNAIRILEREKVSYQHRSWPAATKENTGVELAQALGQPPEQVFKTLVTVRKSLCFYAACCRNFAFEKGSGCRW